MGQSGSKNNTSEPGHLENDLIVCESDYQNISDREGPNNIKIMTGRFQKSLMVGRATSKKFKSVSPKGALIEYSPDFGIHDQVKTNFIDLQSSKEKLFRF